MIENNIPLPNTELSPTNERDSSINDTRQQFEDHYFTKDPSYRHYSPITEQDFKRRDEGVQSFLNNPVLLEPTFSVSKYSIEEIEETEKLYYDLLDQLSKKEKRTLEDDLLKDKIVSKMYELFRYEEILLMLGSTSIEDRKKHQRIVSDLSLEYMGGVDKDSYGVLVNDLLDVADNSKLKEGKELNLLLSRQKIESGSGRHIELENNTREVILNDIYEIFPGLEEIVNERPKNPITPESLVNIVNRLLKLVDLKDWHSELDAGKSARASSKDKAIYIGENRKNLESHKRAVALGVHEVLHAMRSEGKKGANALGFEEGLATMVQQIISGEKRIPGVQYYLAIGLQAGLDRRGVLRNSRETFEIMWRRGVLLQEEKGKEIDIPAARSLALRQLRRARRGGAIDTRDSAYFLGSKKVIDWLNTLASKPKDERIKLLKIVFDNRIDPTNKNHMELFKL